MPNASHAARLLVSCPDRPGIVAAVSRFLFDCGANIVEADQHSTDPAGGTFFMRMAFDHPELDLPRLERDFAVVAREFSITWRMWSAAEPKRVALLVSKHDHCLLDLLWRHRRGELDATIPLVVSNHPDLGPDVAAFSIPFEHVPMPRGDKGPAEARMLALLRDRVDLVVLARYMQILSGAFLEELGVPVINIHHSFLPAFVGANPYAKALERGVKIIGATAHYVTAELDAGPIIEQDVAHVSHRDDLAALVRIGRDIERAVLARAVKAHLEDRVLVHGNKTVVF